MDISKIVIVPKISKYEYDMRRYRLSSEEVIQKYRDENVDADKILRSHENQKGALRILKRFFPEKQFVSREEFTEEIAVNADMVIALGGDNHLQYVSHFVDNQLMMGINSDPEKSVGALTYFNATSFDRILKRLEEGDFVIEEWTRLEARLEAGIGYVGLATCDYFLGEKERKNMSRHIIVHNGRSEEQKGSGLLVVTGAGSTGWYTSASRYLHSDENDFPKTDRMARFVLAEPYVQPGRRLENYVMLCGSLKEGEELTVYSLNDSEGIISNDSLEETTFNRGSKAILKLSDTPVRVVRM
jgi:NAD kinase